MKRLRPTARRILLETWAGLDRGEPLQAALSRALENASPAPGVRRQATDLVYWTLRGLERCRFALSRIYARPEGFSRPVRRLLLGALASLIYQEQAPVYAVVSETVSDIRQLAGKGPAGAANAGLRNFLRLGDAPKDPQWYALEGDRDGWSARFRFFGCPEELGRLILKERGADRAENLLRKSAARPLPAVRLNPLRPGLEELREELLRRGAEALPGPAGRTGLVFPAGTPGEPDLRTLAAEGRLSFQSAGSQLALAELELPPDEPVWDACAGFGGKTTALLESGYRVSLASDLSSRRLSALPGECARLGLPCPGLFLGDAARPPLARWRGSVLLDVPCSGLGVLARRPDIKLRRADPAAQARTQLAILRRALSLPEKGRLAAYLTCTVTETENGGLVRKALEGTDAVIVREWETPEESPFEGMYTALLRV